MPKKYEKLGDRYRQFVGMREKPRTAKTTEVWLMVPEGFVPPEGAEVVDHARPAPAENPVANKIASE
jgi:hypothetical protein